MIWNRSFVTMPVSKYAVDSRTGSLLYPTNLNCRRTVGGLEGHVWICFLLLYIYIYICLFLYIYNFAWLSFFCASGLKLWKPSHDILFIHSFRCSMSLSTFFYCLSLHQTHEYHTLRHCNHCCFMSPLSPAIVHVGSSHLDFERFLPTTFGILWCCAGCKQQIQPNLHGD